MLLPELNLNIYIEFWEDQICVCRWWSAFISWFLNDTYQYWSLSEFLACTTGTGSHLSHARIHHDSHSAQLKARVTFMFFMKWSWVKHLTPHQWNNHGPDDNLLAYTWLSDNVLYRLQLETNPISRISILTTIDSCIVQEKHTSNMHLGVYHILHWRLAHTQTYKCISFILLVYVTSRNPLPNYPLGILQARLSSIIP